MAALRFELAGAGLPISNRSFYEYFLHSPHPPLPRSVQYEMRIKLADVRESSSKGKEKEKMPPAMDEGRRVTSGGMFLTYRGDEKRDDKGVPSRSRTTYKPKAGKGKENAGKPKALSGTLYKAIIHPANATIDVEDSANAFYINSGAPDHHIPS